MSHGPINANNSAEGSGVDVILARLPCSQSKARGVVDTLAIAAREPIEDVLWDAVGYSCSGRPGSTPVCTESTWHG